jgi:hypothetical protein
MTGNFVDYYGANLQAGFGSLGSGGAVFATTVRLDSASLPPVNGVYNYVVQ